LNTVRYIESIRKRLSPQTGTMINEIGIISADDIVQGQPGHVTKPIPDAYWNLAAAEYAYTFGNLAEIGIDVAGESQLVGYPAQFPSVSMVDWKDGKPNSASGHSGFSARISAQATRLWRSLPSHSPFPTFTD
jgi:hypothetical protein